MTKERIYKDYANDMTRIAFWLISNKKKFKTRKSYSYNGKTLSYEKVVERIKKNKQSGSDGFIAEFVESAIVDNSNFDYLPNYVKGHDGVIFYKATYVDMAKRVRAYEITNKKSPRIVYYEKDTNKQNVTVKAVKNTGKVCKSISKATGVTVTDYKTLWNAFCKAVYAYYYDDVYTQAQALSRLGKKLGLNCSDLNQLAYYALKEMGYKVSIVRGIIQCTKQYGHVWCRLTINGKTINFDASSAAQNKSSLGTMICGKVSSITNVNPAWAVSDDGRT